MIEHDCCYAFGIMSFNLIGLFGSRFYFIFTAEFF